MIPIMKYGETPNSEILARKTGGTAVEDTVKEILAAVRAEGDAALFHYTEKFDRAKLDTLLVSDEEMDEAMAQTEPEFLRILEKAAENIREYHSKQIRNNYILTRENGVVMGQKITPVDRAGLYVPGGTAPYPSTVLMDAVPAKLAGVGEVVMVTPPGPDGKVNPGILAAAKVAGVGRIFKVGGAQAIGALTYGTESIPRVDKIVGPGNAWVAEAKRQVYGLVAVDTIAGPSEVLVVADGKSNPRWIAADMLAQAEHDVLSCAVLVTDDADLAKAVQQEVENLLCGMEREAIARASIENNGKIIIADNLWTAIEVANEIAPEHLEICVDNPFDYLNGVKCAGSVFLGRYCPEPLGDYYSGTNHTLPTGGTARFGSPLGVDDFLKKTQFTYYTGPALAAVAEDVAYFAEKEGLTGHARSMRIRSEK